MPHWETIAEEAMVGAGLLVAGLALLPEELAAATLAAVAEGAIYIGAADVAAIIDGVGLAGAAAQYGGAAVGSLETVQTAGAVMVGLGLGVGAVAAGGAIHNGLAGTPGNQNPTPKGKEPKQITPAQQTPALPPPGTQGPGKRPASETPSDEPGAKRSSVFDDMDIDHHMYKIAPGVYYDEDHEMFYDEDDDLYYDAAGHRAKRPGDSNFYDGTPSKKRKQGASFRPAATDTVSVSVLALLAAVTALVSAVTAKLAHSHCHVEVDDGESNVIRDSPPKGEE